MTMAGADPEREETISKVTDAVCDEVLAWQQRPLEALYPVIKSEVRTVHGSDSSRSEQSGHQCANGRADHRRPCGGPKQGPIL